MNMLLIKPRRRRDKKIQREPLCNSVPSCLCGSKIILTIAAVFISFALLAQSQQVINFNKDWKFLLGDDSTAYQPAYDDSKWRSLNLPHDWSIEGKFSEKYSTTFNQGALPAGVGWYRKAFILPNFFDEKKVVRINFDGIYRNSEVWINGHYLGKRPNGYVSFQYDLTPYVKPANEKNVIVVRADNSLQPNSRWYTGSGIYRNVWLQINRHAFFEIGETIVSSTEINDSFAVVDVRSKIRNSYRGLDVDCRIFDWNGMQAGRSGWVNQSFERDYNYADSVYHYKIKIRKPKLWSVDSPFLYKLRLTANIAENVMDRLEITFGIRTFNFDSGKGFFLNGKPLKILGVCNHHDLGALGAAFNTRAAERQLQILKAMGCNAIRTAHNPPAPELLDLCDKMGFLVLDEAFDMWKKRKNKFDYSVDFDEWHQKDLEDMIKRDRNHASVFMWSIGNEIREQFDTSGTRIANELAAIVKKLDPTRPITSALTENVPEKNFIYQSHALDVLGFNYKLADYPELPKRFPGQKFIATETASALETRGHYDFPSDSNRIWPPDAKAKVYGNKDLTASAYDNTFAYWGATHEKSWLAVKDKPYMAGCFVWSGFDFIGEPVPYQWPARSSYYGIVDLAGFPKDVYYLYQSEWTTKPMLHVFPHWNWKQGDSVNVWAYYNMADEVELFLNGRSLGVKKKNADHLHVQWRVAFVPGTLKAVSRKAGHVVMSQEIKTAGKPAKIELVADRTGLQVNDDLSFVTVKVLDAEGNLVPNADNLIHFNTTGECFIAGVDNGSQTSTEPFKANYRKAYNGLCLVILGTNGKKGSLKLTAFAEGLQPATIYLHAH